MKLCFPDNSYKTIISRYISMSMLGQDLIDEKEVFLCNLTVTNSFCTLSKHNFKTPIIEKNSQRQILKKQI
jgi:hypothetical protein